MIANPLSTQIIKNISDVEQIEKVPLVARNLPRSTYEAIHKTAHEMPDEFAIRFIENGEDWKAAREKDQSDISVTVTYAALLENINRSANLFRSLGLSDTEVVSMVLPNVPEAYYVLWGGEAAGIANPINYLLDAAEIGEILESAACKILVIMGKHPDLDIFEKLAVIRAHAPCIEHVVIVGDMPSGLEGCLSFDTEISKQNSKALDFDRDIKPQDIASLFHTGGTTGLPKLAQHSHGNEVYTAWALNCTLGYKAKECTLTGLPIFHCNAAIASGLLGFMSGGTVLLSGLTGYRSPGILSNLFQIINAYDVVGFSAVPTIYGRLVQLPLDDFDISTLRIAGCGAAPMPIELFNRFEKKTDSRILEGYGLTEATVVSTMSTPHADYPRIGSIGIRLPYTRIKAAILDNKGEYIRDCKIDEMGTVLISGPSMTPGYTDASKNSELFVADKEGILWVNTGDLARQDSDGYFWLTGRSKELIIRGGHNIDPKTIEEALASHPAVNLAAAIGRPDSYAGEVPVAYVDTVGEILEAELLEYCKNNIGERAAIPKAVIILESLPVTGVGKIHKPTLHLRELKSTVERELETFSGCIEKSQVDTRADPTLGNMAEIKINSTKDTSIAELERSIRERLGAYSFSYSLVVNSGTMPE